MSDELPNSKSTIQVALYSGPGAELVKDVEIAIREKISYRLINATEIRLGILKNFKLLMMSGGYTANYIPHLKQKGCEAINNFLNMQGGSYLGICAGAYIASFPELRISKSKMVRQAGIYNCKIKIENLNHPIFEGLTDSDLLVYYQNGPHIHPYKNEKSLALYKDGTSSLIETSHALIFSWHPEKLPHTIPILLKSIEFLIRNK